MLLNELILHIFMNHEAQNRDKRLNYEIKILVPVIQKVEKIWGSYLAWDCMAILMVKPT